MTGEDAVSVMTGEDAVSVMTGEDAVSGMAGEDAVSVMTGAAVRHVSSALHKTRKKVIMWGGGREKGEKSHDGH